jgi:hypothetical protein
MKKLILLFCSVTIAFTSCSKDDDSPSQSPSQDPLVGSWTWNQSFYNGTEEVLDDCDKQENIIVNGNGTFTEEYFYDNGSGCESYGTYSGLWENQGNNIYKITYYAGTGDEEVILITITFSGNTFTMEETDGSDTYKDVYIRK